MTTNGTPALTKAHLDRIAETMTPRVRELCAGYVLRALDAGKDLIDRKGGSPAVKYAADLARDEATAKGWSQQAIAILRIDVEIVGAEIVADAFAACK